MSWIRWRDRALTTGERDIEARLPYVSGANPLFPSLERLPPNTLRSSEISTPKIRSFRECITLEIREALDTGSSVSET